MNQLLFRLLSSKYFCHFFSLLGYIMYFCILSVFVYLIINKDISTKIYGNMIGHTKHKLGLKSGKNRYSSTIKDSTKRGFESHVKSFPISGSNFIKFLNCIGPSFFICWPVWQDLTKFGQYFKVFGYLLRNWLVFCIIWNLLRQIVYGIGHILTVENGLIYGR